MTARQLLAHKGTALYTIDVAATLAEAAGRLDRHGVGALLVFDGPSPAAVSLAGVVSERDLVGAVAERGALGLALPVRAAMSAPAQTCGPDDTVRTLMARMTARRIRHLPVVEDGTVVGVVSIGDVVRSRVAEAEGAAAVLQDALTVRWASALGA